MISMKSATLAVAAIAAALAAGAAHAHHAAVMFDRSKPVVVRGTVKEFQWVNPHAFLLVTADAGQPEGGKTWVIEMTSPGRLNRDGWTKRTVSPGDKIEVQIGPLRSGGAAGVFMQGKKLPSGEVLGAPGAPG